METTSPTHATTFRLNLQKGITNIGSHPANDIVIDDPRVQPFHLILDHRKKPFHIISLSPESNIRLNGVTIAGNEPIEVKDLNQVQFNGFSLHANLNTVGGETGEIEITPPRFQSESPSALEVLPVLPQELLPEPSLPARISGLEKATEPRQFPPALKDDIILVTLIEVNQQVDVETPAVYRLSVINAGPIVASFDVHIEGVPPEWVSISPRKLNLYESGRGECEIHVAAPRDPASTAASYPIQFSVSSPNYPDHLGQVNSNFVLNPYYEYTLGNLDPKQRSASYNKRIGAVAFPISNLGNSSEIYQVSAADDENGLQFEFPQPDQTRLARQAEVKVGAGETKAIPMVINPIRRNLFRLRGRQYHYNVHARQTDQEGGGQIVSGGFTSHPLLGFFSLLLIVSLAAVAVFFLMRPRITEFYAVKDIVEKGQAVTLRWKVSFFTRDLFIEGLPDPIQGTQSQVSTMPNSVASTYTLVASNWLSRTLRMPDLRSAPVTVLTIPAPPAITTFSVDKDEAFVGDIVNAKWSIGNADLAYLTVDGVTTILAPESFNGELPIMLTKDTLVVLEAKNNAGSLVRSEFLQAREPSIEIAEFSLSKTTITLGDPVTIRWKVTGVGAESVRITPFEEPLPLQGELTFYPKESMEFVMSVENRDLKEIRLLPVGVLPPGAPPEPPAISFFKAAPNEMVGEGTTEFSWSVSGTTDKIEITSSGGLIAGALPAQGFKSTSVKSTTNYVLTAYNKEATTSAILEVKIKPDLMATQVLINSTIPTSSIMRGDKMQVYFSVVPMLEGKPILDVIAAKLPEVSGKVVVTDGFDTCEAELPKTSCVIQLNTSSANKKLTATYGGDASYARRTSPPYPGNGTLSVIGTPASFKLLAFDPVDVNLGLLTKLSFTLGPTDPTKVDPVTGEVQVFQVIDGQESTTSLCRVNLGGVLNEANQGTGSCSFGFPTTGTKTLRVKYMGNAVYDGVIEDITLSVTKGKSITTITTNLAVPTVTGQTLQVSVLVKADGGISLTPTGQVYIYDQADNTIGCYAALAEGIGACNLVFNRAGDRQVVAQYLAGTDANFESSPSGTFLHPVSQASTKTVFTSLPSQTYVGQDITFSFKSEVLAPGSGTLSGESVVMDGTKVFCTGFESCWGTIDSVAPKAFKVVYDPANTDTNYGTSESALVSYTPLPSATKFTLFSASTVPAGGDPTQGTLTTKIEYKVIVEAEPYSSVMPKGTVTVKASTGEQCQISVPGSDTCQIETWNSEGLRTVRATFIDNDQNYTTSQSDTLQYVIKKYSTVTVATVVPSTVLIDQPVLFTVTVMPGINSGNDIPTGKVYVYAGEGVGSDSCEVILGKYADGTTAPTNRGSCSLTFTREAKGATALAVSAQYQGDTLFVSSQTAVTDPPQVVTVNRAPTQTQITSVATNSPLLGQTFAVNFKVTKTDSNTYNSSPTGTVTVSSGKGETCTGTILSDKNDPNNGTGTCAMSLSNLGAHYLTAAYTETADVLRFENSSTADSTTVTVPNANTAVTVHITRNDNTTEDITTAVVNESVLVSFTVSTLNSVLIPAQENVVTVTSNSPDAEQCTTLPNPSTGIGSCVLKLTHTGNPTIITVAYPGGTGFNSSSTAKPIIVSEASVTLTLSDSPATIYVGQSLTYNVGVTPVAPSVGAPSGVVTLTAVSGANTATGTCTTVANGTASCTIFYPIPGTWALTLSFAANDDYLAQSLTPPTANVVQDTTTTSVILNSGTYMVDSPINFVVRVDASNSTQVPLSLPNPLTFVLNNSGTVACDAATTGYDANNSNKAYLTANCRFTPTISGAWTIQATYPGDAAFVGSQTSSLAALTVSPIPTQTFITVNATNPLLGQTFTVNFSVTKTAGDPGPTGTVKVFSDRGEECTGTLSTTGTGSCEMSLTQMGIHVLKATYTETAGVLRFDTSSTSSESTVTVTEADTYISANFKYSGTEINAALINQPVLVSFTVSTAVAGVTPTSATVTVSADMPDGEKCTDLLVDGAGSCTLRFTKTGSRTIAVTYPGATGFKSKTIFTSPLTITKASVSLTATPNPTTIHVGEMVTYTVGVQADMPSDGSPSGSVTLTAADTATPQAHTATGICTAVTSGTASCTIYYPNPGTWTLTLTYSDAGAQYEPKTLTPAPTATVIKDSTTTISIPSTPTPVVDSPVSFVVRVSAANSTTVLLSLPNPFTFALNKPGGSALTTADITCGSLTSGFDSNSPYKAYLTAICGFTPDVKGDWKITTTYPGDSNFAGSSAAQITIAVGPLPTPMILSGNPTNVPYYVNQSYTFTATITYTKNAPTGFVVFSATGANTTLPTCTSVVLEASDNGIVTCTTSFANIGDTTVTAAYAGDSKFTPAVDQTFSFTVVKIGTALSATTNPLSSSISVNRGDDITPAFAFSVTAPALGSTVNGGTISIQATPAGLFKTPPTLQSCTVASGTCTISASVADAATPGVYTVTAIYEGGTTSFASSASLTLGTLTVRYPTTLTAVPNPFPVSVNQGATLSLTLNVANLVAPGTTVTAGTVSIQTSPADLFSSPPTCIVASGACTATLAIPADAAPGAYTVTATYGATSTFASSTSGSLGILTVRYPTTLSETAHPLTTPVSVNPGDLDAVSFVFTVTATGTTVDAGTVSIQATQVDAPHATLFTTPPSCDVLTGACTKAVSIPSSATPGAYTVTATYTGTPTFAPSATLTLGILTVRYLSSYQGIFNYCEGSSPSWTICYLVVEVSSGAPSTLAPFSSTDKIEVKITPTDTPATTTTLSLDYIKAITSGSTTYYVFRKLNSAYLSTTATYTSIVITPTSTAVNPLVKPFDKVTLTPTPITGIAIKAILLP